MELQRKCGMSAVAGTDLVFRLHIGITCGDVESVILKARSTENMQGAYHYVSGLPLSQTASVVDAARTGEVCVTQEIHTLCGRYLQCSTVKCDIHSEEEEVEETTKQHDRLEGPTGTVNEEGKAKTKSKKDRPCVPEAKVYRLDRVDDDVEDILSELPRARQGAALLVDRDAARVPPKYFPQAPPGVQILAYRRNAIPVCSLCSQAV